MGTPNDKIVAETEEQVKKDNERFEELKKKPESELQEEEKKELGDLKEKYSLRVEKRINQLTSKARLAEEQLEAERKEKEDLRRRLEDIERNREPVNTPVKQEMVQIGDKKYYTDEALIAMVKSGELDETKAYQYQRSRDKAELKEELKRDFYEDKKRESEEELRSKDAKDVLEKYPHFAKTHPNFDPDDPVYKLATEMYDEGYRANPRGLSLAIKRAKEILKIQDEPIDRSDDLVVERSSVPTRRSEKEKEVTLSEDEKTAAIRMYGRGDVINPKTNKPYSEAEAIAKALQAKKARSR